MSGSGHTVTTDRLMCSMKHADAENCMYDKTPVVFVADQLPFETNAGTFCLLQPLMTLSAERFKDSAVEFPNRGRVWWMLRQGIGDVTAGSLWLGRLQRASIDDIDRPDKDKYQVVKEEIQPNLREWVAVVEYDIDAPSPEEILDGMLELPAGKPTPEFLLRFRNATMGPFRLAPAWNANGRLNLTVHDLGRPEVTVASVAPLKGEQRFDLMLAKLTRNSYETPRAATVVLVPRKVALELKGEKRDAMSSSALIKWALERAGLTKHQQKPVKDALEAFSKLPSSAVDPERVQRFKQLCDKAMRGSDLGLEAARALAESERFAPLLERHAEALVQEEVQRLVGERRTEVERELESAREQVERVRHELSELETRFDYDRLAQERRLEDEKANWLRKLKEREEAVARAETELADKQAKFGRALAGAVEEYRERSETVLKEVLTLLPLLPRSSQVTETLSPAVDGGKLLPKWLDEPKGRAGLIEKEAEFIDQLADVARKRGYLYPREVLVAFHASAKSGVWTVLAGPSGVGKSSLPQLYAEALGQRQELLQIAVRPDWLDDRQVLGSFNPLNGRYESAPTGLTEHLIHAAEDWRLQRGGIFLVLLDEMNLARVEHYFARFLSIMERRPDERSVELFSRTQENPGDPMARYRVLSVSPNVRFVGTVNLDETVHFFSPKVLDRCSIVGIPSAPLDVSLQPQVSAKDLGLRAVAWNAFESWCRPASDCPSGITQLLQVFDGSLRNARSSLGYRSLQRARTFAAGAKGLMSDDAITDQVIFQFVLPRVRLVQRDSKRIIDDLRQHVTQEKHPRSTAAVTRMQDGEEYFNVVG